MTRFLPLILLLISSVSYANTQLSVLTGPAKVNFLTDRYSSQGTFEIFYKGYLVDCSRGSNRELGITAHVIFHSENETQIFKVPMLLICERTFYTDQTNVAMIRIHEVGSPMWSYIEEFRFHRLDLELAFEKDGRWDSDYGRNFRVSF